MSELPTLKVVKVFSDAQLPKKPNTTKDAGYDIYAYKVDAMFIHGGGNAETKLEGEDIARRFTEPGVFELQCNERVMIDTGIRATVADGWEIQVRPRSGHAWKRGLTVLNSPGTIDFTYTGNIKVIIINTSRQTQSIKLGEAIAQIVPKRVDHLEIEIVEKLDDTARGDGGFGSTEEKMFQKKKQDTDPNRSPSPKFISL